MLKQFKRFLLVKAGICKDVNLNDIYVDWCEAEIEDEEWMLLYG